MRGVGEEEDVPELTRASRYGAMISMTVDEGNSHSKEVSLAKRFCQYSGFSKSVGMVRTR